MNPTSQRAVEARWVRRGVGGRHRVGCLRLPPKPKGRAALPGCPMPSPRAATGGGFEQCPPNCAVSFTLTWPLAAFGHGHREGPLSQPLLLPHTHIYWRPPIQGSCPQGQGGEDIYGPGWPRPLCPSPCSFPAGSPALPTTPMLQCLSQQGLCAKPQKDQRSTFLEH